MNEAYNRWCHRRVVAIFLGVGEQVYKKRSCSLISGMVEENSVRISILMTNLDDHSASLRDTILEKWRKAKKFVSKL